MYVTVIPPLQPACLVNADPSRLRSIVGEHACLLRYGRDALWLGLKLLGLGRGDSVLLPASLCDVAIIPFLNLGIGLRYYPLDRRLAFDPRDIEARIDETTRAIFVNHYLGVPADTGSLRAICDRHGLYLIEDCAHGFAGRGNHGLFGTAGDMAIFSLRKFFPLPDGGALRFNRPFASAMPETGPSNVTATLRGTAKLLASALALRGLLPVAKAKARRGDVESYLAFSDDLDSSAWRPPAGMSKIGRWIMDRCDIADTISRRRRNYTFWQNNVGAVPGAQPLFPALAEGQNPFCFPVLMEDRDAFVRFMAGHGIYLEPTIAPPYRNVQTLANPDEPFDDLEYVAAHMVSLPVHQGLTPRHLERLLARMRSL